MGNADEATIDDDGEFESRIDGLLEEIKNEKIEDPEEPKEPKMAMQEGGAVPSVNTQMEKAMQPRMNPTEIIRKDLERDGFTKQEQNFFKVLASSVAKGVSSLVQINNTVFVGTHIGNDNFRVHLFTQDNPQMLSGAIEKYADVLLKSGIQKIYSSTENTKIISLLQSLGYTVESKKEGNKYLFTVEKL
jgi:hypothetical protein